MKLAFVTTCGFPDGGSEKLWIEVARFALRKGHQVQFSAFDFTPRPVKHLLLENLGAQARYRRRYYPTFLYRAKKKLFNMFLPFGQKITYHEYINSFAPDFILFNLASGDELASDEDFNLFVEQINCPFAICLHTVAPNFTFEDEIKEKLRKIFSNARRIYFTSEFQRLQWEKAVGISIFKYSKMFHPISCFSFQERFESPIVRIGIVGSLIKRWKGQDIAISILSSSNWKDLPWRLYIIGDGEDKACLQEQIKVTQISNKVHFTGALEPKNIWAELDLLLIPSRQDSGPIVCIEAMFHNVLVVANPIGIIPELIADGETGFISDHFSTESFNDTLERAWEKRNLWKKITSNALRMVKETYPLNGPEIMLRELENEVY